MARLIGRAGPALLVVLAVSALTTASASATPIHFNPEVVKFSTTSGTSVFTIGTVGTITCSSDTGTSGETAKEGGWSWVSMLFEKCNSRARCFTALGFEALSGELGTVAASEAASEVGIMLKVNSVMECSPTEVLKIRGDVAGEFTSPFVATGNHNLVFKVASGAQKIKKIKLNSGTVEPKLEMELDGSGWTLTTFESEEKNSMGTVEVVL